MIALILALVELSVKYQPNGGDSMVLITSGQKITRIIRSPFDDGNLSAKFLALLETVKFGGRSFSAVEGQLVDSTSKDSFDVPMAAPPQYEGLYAPRLRSKGGLSLGKTMLWIYSWDNMDIQLDPAVLVTAFEFGIRNGKLVLLRRADLTGMTGYGSPGIFRSGSNFLFFNASRNLSVFNPEKWQEVRKYLETISLALSGKLYKIEKQTLSISHDGLHWKELRKIGSSYLEGVHSFGNQDVLEINKSLMLARNGQTYDFGDKWINGYRAEVFADSKWGVGVVWKSFGERGQTVGTWLGTDLKQRIPIVRD